MKKIFNQPTDLAMLEKEVMKMLLHDENACLNILYQQYLVSQVTTHNLTKVGFFITFIVPYNIQRVNDTSFTFGDVVAEMDGLKHGAGFVLFVKHGAINMLEGYTYNESWPSEIVNLRLSYVKDKRDLSSLPTTPPEPLNKPLTTFHLGENG